MDGPHDMDDSPQDTAHAFIRMARSQLDQLTVMHLDQGERYIKELLEAAARSLDDDRDVTAEWRDAYAALRSGRVVTLISRQKTLDVLSEYEDTPESQRFALIIEALAVFSPPPRSAPRQRTTVMREVTVSHGDVREGAERAQGPSPLIGHHTSVPNDALIAAAELLEGGVSAMAGEIRVSSGCTIKITNKDVVFYLDK